MSNYTAKILGKPCQDPWHETTPDIKSSCPTCDQAALTHIEKSFVVGDKDDVALMWCGLGVVLHADGETKPTSFDFFDVGSWENASCDECRATYRDALGYD